MPGSNKKTTAKKAVAKKAAKAPAKKAPAKKAAEPAPIVDEPEMTTEELLEAVAEDPRPILLGTTVVKLVHETDALTVEDAIDEFIEMVNHNGLRNLMYVIDNEHETFAAMGDGSGEILRPGEVESEDPESPETS